ncbi:MULTISPECIES: cytochrome P450 [Streptacidiphilus]|uniref:Cytochrome P450 n=2 Tax=Streptacidiphilus TaxID=228398 RepID=A0ABV6UML9_9ACTN|nr:cytochrome P450 [Streptacidiphilus jeojiense]
MSQPAGTIAHSPDFPLDRPEPLAPPQEYQLLRQERPASRITLYDGSQAWLLTRYEDVRSVLTDLRFSADARRDGFPFVSPAVRASVGGRTPFFRMDPPDHDRIRRMLTRDFMVKNIEALRPQIQQIVDGFLENLLAQPQPADLVREFALPIPSAVIARLLGVPYEDHEYFQSRGQRMLSRDSTLQESAQSVVDLREYIGRLAESRLTDPGDDVLSRLVVEREATGELDREDVKSTGLLLLVAGHETTANMIALSVATLLGHPEQLAALRADPALIGNAVEELLRFLSVVHSGVPRVALEDIEIAGVTVRAGEGVIASIPAANWDPEHFATPEDFDIHRDARRHIAFGFGIHQCLGQPLARVELEIALTTLLRRLPGLRLADGAEYAPEKAVYGLHRLPVAW